MAMKSTFKKQRSLDRELRTSTVADRRRASIERREVARVAPRKATPDTAVSTKYQKRDVVHLKQIFDEYDMDGSGFIDKAELVAALQKEKTAVQRLDGRRKTLEQRQAERGMVQGQAASSKGVFLVDFSESLFRAMDANLDGRVEFHELLRLVHPFASQAELGIMLGWVSAKGPIETLDDFVLTDEQRREIHSMFRLYDKDRSGTISPSEFREAMRRCGLDAAETDELFREFDLDGNRTIDREEFTELMRAHFFNGEDFTFTMLYGPI